MQDPLEYLPLEKWSDLQNIFKSDFPRSLLGYYVLETQRRWLQQGLQSNFKVYCPYGDLSSGMVAINRNSGLYGIIIQCPSNDTTKLEDAIKKTKIIAWNETKILSDLSDHFIDCFKRISAQVNLDITIITPCVQFVLDKTSSPFVDRSLPPEITFKLLSPKHAKLINSLWPRHCPNSDKLFENLINSKTGHGLFRENILIAWVFTYEVGALGHLYVIEEYRRKGYGELILKLTCNLILEKDRDVFGYVKKDNVKSCNLFEKLGFRATIDTSWVYFQEQV